MSQMEQFLATIEPTSTEATTVLVAASTADPGHDTAKPSSGEVVADRRGAGGRGVGGRGAGGRGRSSGDQTERRGGRGGDQPERRDRPSGDQTERRGGRGGDQTERRGGRGDQTERRGGRGDQTERRGGRGGDQTERRGGGYQERRGGAKPQRNQRNENEPSSGPRSTWTGDVSTMPSLDELRNSSERRFDKALERRAEKRAEWTEHARETYTAFLAQLKATNETMVKHLSQELVTLVAWMLSHGKSNFHWQFVDSIPDTLDLKGDSEHSLSANTVIYGRFDRIREEHDQLSRVEAGLPYDFWSGINRSLAGKGYSVKDITDLSKSRRRFVLISID